MTSSKSYLDFILEQLSGLEEISYRAMMGEYLLYYRGKLVGGIYDDRLLLKAVPALEKRFPEMPKEQPYPGAKEMLMPDCVDERERLSALFQAAWEELPEAKQKPQKRH